jgi:hypothetical protein
MTIVVIGRNEIFRGIWNEGRGGERDLENWPFWNLDLQ